MTPQRDLKLYQLTMDFLIAKTTISELIRTPETKDMLVKAIQGALPVDLGKVFRRYAKPFITAIIEELTEAEEGHNMESSTPAEQQANPFAPLFKHMAAGALPKVKKYVANTSSTKLKLDLKDILPEDERGFADILAPLLKAYFKPYRTASDKNESTEKQDDNPYYAFIMSALAHPSTPTIGIVLFGVGLALLGLVGAGLLPAGLGAGLAGASVAGGAASYVGNNWAKKEADPLFSAEEEFNPDAEPTRQCTV